MASAWSATLPQEEMQRKLAASLINPGLCWMLHKPLGGTQRGLLPESHLSVSLSQILFMILQQPVKPLTFSPKEELV